MREFCALCQKTVDSNAWRYTKVGFKDGAERFVYLCDKHFKPRQYELGYIKKQRDRFRDDLVQPWGLDGKPNPDFIKLYPDQAIKNFSEKDLKGVPTSQTFAQRFKKEKGKIDG